MMITAEHIIGLSALELGHYYYDDSGKRDVASAIRARFEGIQRQGYLMPRGNTPRDPYQHGSQFAWDLLAGDGRYIFLSAGARYREIRQELAYGFVFDAEQLIRAGALVGPDLLDDYGELADQVAQEIEKSLPAPAPVPDAELKEFAELMGIEDQRMLEFIRTDSIRSYYDIIRGMEEDDLSVPGVAEALTQWKIRISALQSKKRKRGRVALKMLRSGRGMEILIERTLDLRQAIAIVEAGQIIWR